MKKWSGDFAISDSSLIAAAHELKSPVALIRQLALELDLNARSDQKDILEQLILTSERSLRLTTSLTRYRQLNESLNVLNTEPVNAQQLCEEVAHELWPIYKAHGRSIEVAERRSSPLVVANRDLLRRILLHFGDNALQYSHSGKVLFRVNKSLSGVRVGLRDDGPTSPDVKNPLIGRPASSGLGLMISSRFAEMMDGSIGSVRHRNGMTFYVQVIPSEQLALL
ncbi:HAMP domain-containing histidine kinase [Candidatus Saccharibacteria bacterium]|jgi:signal transduction histidine kinase|nr:HAMP domain-containing histidine kinase [Candidatus Saccharibacteria bacterium]